MLIDQSKLCQAIYVLLIGWKARRVCALHSVRKLGYLACLESHIPNSSQYLINEESDKKVLEIKLMQNLISCMECAIRLSVSSTIIILFQFKKSTQKLKKVQNIENGKFDEKSA